MRGPFDIHERVNFSSSRKSIRNPKVNHVLLNPDSEDGCWDILFMICGGTGITPMIQLVIISNNNKYCLNYLLTKFLFIYFFFLKKNYRLIINLKI